MSTKNIPPKPHDLLQQEHNIETAPPPISDPVTHSVLSNKSRYEDASRLAEGGMSVVSRAFDAQEHRLVVIKKFKKQDRENNASLQQRIQREFDLLRAVEHPNVVKVYEIWKEENALILEFVRGETLRSYFHRQKEPLQPPDLQWVREIFFSLLDVIEHLHNKGYAYLDLKPENIMLTKDKGLKLIDFGMAHPLHQPLGSDAEGGSPYYTAPEYQNRDFLGTQDHPCDPSADIYSLASILFELLTNERPIAPLKNLDDVYARKNWPLLLESKLFDDFLATNTDSDHSVRFEKVAKLKRRLKVLFEQEFRAASLQQAVVPLALHRRGWSLVLGIVMIGLILWILFAQGKLFSPVSLEQKQAPKARNTQTSLAALSDAGNSSPANAHSKVVPRTVVTVPAVEPRVVVQPRVSVPLPATPSSLDPSIANSAAKKRTLQEKASSTKKRVRRKKKAKKKQMPPMPHKKTADPNGSKKQEVATAVAPSFLDISISPPCDLYQGDKNLGVAFGRLLPFPSGKHDLRCVKRDGFVFHRFSVVIQPGKTTRYSRLLGKGALFVVSYPWAKVCLPDFDFHCIGSSQQMLSLYEGKYRVVLLKEGNPEYRRDLTVHIRPQQTSRPKVIW